MTTTAKETMLAAFDRLFDHAARKLNLDCSPEDKAQSRQQFEERFSGLLDGLGELPIDHIPEEVISGMEKAIDQVSPSEVAGLLASMPIAHQAQEMLRSVAYRAAEQKMLEHLIGQTDDRFGGN